MTNRFDLEERIMHCWQICDDLDYVAAAVEDDDNASNLVLGLKALYQAKFEKLWEVFEGSIQPSGIQPGTSVTTWGPYHTR